MVAAMTNHRYRHAVALALTTAGALLAATAIFAGVAARPTLFAIIATVTMAAVLLAVAACCAEGTMFQAAPFSVLIFLPAVATLAAFAAPHLADSHTERQVTEFLAASAPPTAPTAADIHSAVLSAGAIDPVVSETAPGHFVVSFQLDDAGPTLSRTTVCVQASYSPTAATLGSITPAIAGNC